MDKLLIFIGGGTLFYLIGLGIKYIEKEGFFLPSQIKLYYEQIKCRLISFSKETQNKLLLSAKENLKQIYRSKDNCEFEHTIINNQNDCKFVECFVNIYLYINLKDIHYLNKSDELLKKDLLKKSYTECKNYLTNKDNYNKELINWLEYKFDKNDEVYYG